jgi:hypothetical protein
MKKKKFLYLQKKATTLLPFLMVSTTSLTSPSSTSAGSSATTASKVTFSTSGAGDSAAGAAVAFEAVADVLFSGGVTDAGSSFAALDVFELGVTLLQGLVIYIGLKAWRKNEKRTVVENPPEDNLHTVS